MSGAVVVHPDPGTLAHATAARLLLRLIDAQSVRRPVHVALTGGTVGTRVLGDLAVSPLRDAVDWRRVHLWWGDDRFVPHRFENQGCGSANVLCVVNDQQTHCTVRFVGLHLASI